jgi:glycogen operon protein
MHVDGFRFDLASALARELHAVDRLGAFFDIIHQDPVLSQVKLIAEPWDLGEGGYQVGNFPVLWAEWNGVYRDTVRSFWKGDAGQVGSMAYRLTGSSDLYGESGRKPHASINFVTAHDGFTLHDLVSYNEKHNQVNGEDNQDGTNDNLSWNCGTEGATSKSAISDLRERQKRNFLATLLLSQGVPMLLAGDETGRTQQGNNNGYCQDNEISWMDWDLDPRRESLLEFTRSVITIFHEHPVLRRRKFFQGREIRGSGVKDLTWFGPDGEELTGQDFDNGETHCFGLSLAGDAIDETDSRGNRVVDDTLLILLNSHFEAAPFVLPELKPNCQWQLLLDTREGMVRLSPLLRPRATFQMEARSLALFSLAESTQHSTLKRAAARRRVA